jgi:hypothetical protein
MRRVRFQVFISSTFRDLQKERQAVLDAILSVGHLPAGMELFPASDATPWEVIARIIDDSDYYILVVGGLYGSTDSSGISYTEREYDYAAAKGIPILSFLHGNPDAIPAGKVELREDAQIKLAAFRKKIGIRHCKCWLSAEDLQYKVAVGLVQEINLNPRTGWVRANEVLDVADDKLRKALDDAAIQRKLRADAERRAQDLEQTLAALSRQQTKARVEADAAAREEALALARQREAKEARRESSVKSTQEKVPTSFVSSAAETLLRGDRSEITGFVAWDDTPQGHEFWSAERSRLERGEQLSEEARAAIAAWVGRGSAMEDSGRQTPPNNMPSVRPTKRQ